MQPQLFVFARSEVEHEICRETLGISLNLLVQSLDGDAVKFRQIIVEKNLVAANEEDPTFDRPLISADFFSI